MLTTLSITSLDQGGELARRQVEKLYAEPAQPVPEVVVEEIAAARVHPASPKRQSLVARFLSVFDAALPIGAWRL